MVKNLQMDKNQNWLLQSKINRQQLQGNDELMLTNRQIAKIKKFLANGTGSDIKISRTQIRGSVKHGGNLFTSLASLGAKLLPYAMQGVSKVAPAMATGVATALSEIGLKKLLENESQFPKNTS